MNLFSDLLEALEDANRSRQAVNVFFRDDDADDDLPNLHQLLEMFIWRGAAINLAVIPGTLTGKGADLLLRTKRDHPSLVELNQHGYSHINHETTCRKCEFGPSRTYEQQLRDISRGRDLMCSAFESAWRPMFTPPWNRCTSDTLRAIEELDFLGLSRHTGEEVDSRFRLPEVSTTFDLYTWKDGARLKPAATVSAALSEQVRRGLPIGILLHHKVFTPEAFLLLGELLDVFLRGPVVQLHTFETATHLFNKECVECQA